MNGPVLTFDSGFGGLSVLRLLVQAFPSHDHIFIADDLGFPYGDWPAEALSAHCVATIARLIETYQPCLIVIACNTASTLVLEPLRAAFSLPFVGTVPAIKPAAEQTKSALVSVLATPATVKRDYTRTLVDRYAAHCDVTLVGSTRLAAMAERYLAEGLVDEEAMLSEIQPCFQVRDEKKTDVVVLACTHYPLILPFFERLAPWPVLWLDPAPAIARRVASLLPHAVRDGRQKGERVFATTSGAPFASKAMHFALMELT